MLSVSHTNTVISDRFTYPSRWLTEVLFRLTGALFRLTGALYRLTEVLFRQHGSSGLGRCYSLYKELSDA